MPPRVAVVDRKERVGGGGAGGGTQEDAADPHGINYQEDVKFGRKFASGNAGGQATTWHSFLGVSRAARGRSGCFGQVGPGDRALP